MASGYALLTSGVGIEVFGRKHPTTLSYIHYLIWANRWFMPKVGFMHKTLCSPHKIEHSD